MPSRTILKLKGGNPSTVLDEEIAPRERGVTSDFRMVSPPLTTRPVSPSFSPKALLEVPEGAISGCGWARHLA